MFRSGTFTDSRGGQYQIYECEDTGYYRFDICEKGAHYQIEPDKVLYSKYTKKDKVYIFGERTLYQEVTELKNTLNGMRGESKTTSGFLNGEFQLKNQKVMDDSNFIITEYIDGTLNDTTYRHDDVYLILAAVGNGAGLSMAPLNLSEYASISLSDEAKYQAVSPYIPLNILEIRFNLSHLKSKDYKFIETIEEAREYVKLIVAAGKAGKLRGVDTETTGLDVDLYGKDELVGIIVSIENEISRYFPFGHTKEANLPMSFLRELMEALMPYCANDVAHNKKFDRKVFYKYGFDYRIGKDSFTISMLVDPRVGRGIHALKDMEERRSGDKYLEFSDIFTDRNNINFADLPKDLVAAYACPDAGNAVENWKDQYTKLPVYERYLLDVELELADLKADQEYWGFNLDVEKFNDGYANCDYSVDLLQKLIYAMTRTEFNVNSGDALSDLLYNKMHCKIYSRTKTQRPSTGTKALTKLSKQKREVTAQVVTEDILDLHKKPIVKAKDLNEAEYPIVLMIMKFKEYIKLQTAFYKRVKTNQKSSYDKAIGDMSACTRYFTWINPNGAESGRQSSPMHQLPPEIKDDILADSSMHYLVDTDYMSMELRILPSLAGEKALVEREKNPDTDIHRAIGSSLANCEEYEISKPDRQRGKRRNFGVVYKISPFGLAEQIYGANPTKAQVRAAQESIDEFFLGFPRIAKFIRDNRTKVLRDGKMHTLFGRVRYFPQIFDPDIDSSKRESLIRQANNLPVQGTGADITKIAEVNYDRECRNKGYNNLVSTPQGKFQYCRCMLSIHDELLCSHYVDQPVEEALKMARDAMEIEIKMKDENGDPLDFAPLYAESSVAVSWGEGHSDNYKVPRKLRDRMIAEWERTGVSAVKSRTPAGIRDEVKALVDKFHEEEFVGYMEGLIAEFGENVNNVTSHVRHPSLTFDLLDRFPQTDEDVKTMGNLSHKESIRYAVAKYFEFRKSASKLTPLDHIDERTDDEKIKVNFDTIVGEVQNLVEVDNDGNPVYEDGVSDDDSDTFMFDDEEESIHNMTTGEAIYVWRLFDAYCIDVNTMSVVDCNELLRKLYELNNPDGFYAIKFLYGGKLLETKIQVETLDEELVTEFIKSHSSTEEAESVQY